MTIVRASSSTISVRSAELQELVQRFLLTLDIAASSKATYSRQLKQFVHWLETTGRAARMNTLQRADILAYKNFLTETGKKPSSVSGYLAPVRRLFDWLEGEGVYPNIARSVKGAKKPRGFRKDCLTVNQLQEALGAIDQTTAEGLRDYAMINLMVRTGLRTIEVAGAALGDIRQDSGEAVLWIRGKGRSDKDDFVVLLPETLKPIRKWLASRGPLGEDAPLFCSLSDRNRGQAMTTRSISRIVKKALRAIGLDDSRLTAHSLRHTAVTLSVKGGASLQQVQAMARHSDPKTTMIYFHNEARVKSGAERYIRF